MQKKHWWSILAVALVALSLSACGKSNSQEVKLGIYSSDHEIWGELKERLAKEDINLKITEFNDYNTPNQALVDGDIDLNAFQHTMYLNTWNKQHKTNLVPIGVTYLAPLRAYSKKIKSLSELKNGDQIAVPNDPSNEGRALKMLEAEGLIKLKAGENPTVRDITTNSKKLKIVELDAAQVAASLTEVAAAVVNNDIAASAKLKPEGAIAVEKISAASKPWMNLIVGRKKADKDNATYKKIVKAYQTEATAKLIKKYYKGSAVPAWE